MYHILPKTSFSNFFLFFLFISILLPLVILGGAGLFVSSGILKEELTLADKRETRLIAERIDHALIDPENMLVLLGELLDLEIDKDSNELLLLLEIFTHSNNYIYGIQIADLNGILTSVYPEDRIILGTDISGHDYFKNIMEFESPYWAPAQISEQHDTPVASLSIPVKKGLLTAFLSLDNISTIMTNDIFEEAKSFVYVTDQKGVFIYHPEKDKVLLQEYDP